MLTIVDQDDSVRREEFVVQDVAGIRLVLFLRRVDIYEVKLAGQCR